MALISTDFMTATGLYGTYNDKIDCSDVLSAILLKDTATLGQIPIKGTVKNIEHFWLEDTLNGCLLFGSISVGASADNAYLMQRNVASSKIHKLVVGNHTILRQEGYATHLFKAPMGVSSSTTISLVPYGSMSTSSDALVSAANGTSTRWFIVGKPFTDEEDASGDISGARTRRRNVTQIYERGIEITETREHIDLYAISDELKTQIKYRTLEVKRELNNSVINSWANHGTATYSADTPRRTMAGLVNLIRDPDLDGTLEDSNVLNASAGALTLNKINDLCKLIYDNGGFDDGSNCCIIVGPYQARVIALLEEGRIRKSSNELVVGSYANAVKTDLGFDVPVVLDRWMPGDLLMVLDKSRVALMPLQGDTWHLEKMAKSGRQQKYQLSGQYTLELRNAEEAHGLYIGLACT